MSLQYIKGVGPKRRSKLNKLGIFTIEDLIYYFPRSYEDRREFSNLSEAVDGEKKSFKVKIIGHPSIIKTRNRLNILKVPVMDNTEKAQLTWFNQNYMKNKIKLGDTIYVNGKISKRNGIEIVSPVIENKKNIFKIIPTYSLSQGITNNELSKIIKEAIKSNSIEEVLPIDIIKKYKFMSRYESIKNIHFPENRERFLLARRRLVYEELLILQLGLLLMKNNINKGTKTCIHSCGEKEIQTFIDELPFNLTEAQKRVFLEIENDMGSKKTMKRLIQGDVGSGKTIVAILSMIKAIASGYQVAMMVPTEILARQHYESISKYLSNMDIRVEILVGSISVNRKKDILSRLENGEIDIIVGTHALIQKKVIFYNLGLAITDEQHRFGVKQRSDLSLKGTNPDVLVMTATPIPRTLALILYGDLDISIIDELPPGRKNIETYIISRNKISRMNNFIKKQVESGRQVYVVAPLIEQNEKTELNSVYKLYNEFKEETFKDYRIGLLHGEMSSEEKDNVMSAFKNHFLDILVSTTVIEVGVNIPNANLIIIYNAERFGLAQLHQLRGRVGRGNYKSYCILINEGKSNISIERMKIFKKTNDGFYISEKDLELRGPGEFFGTKQHGVPELKIANLFKDIEILKIAQEDAINILKEDPYMLELKYKKLKEAVLCKFKNEIIEFKLN